MYIFVGTRGLYNTSGNLKIAYLSGISNKEKKKNSFEFDKSDINSLRDMCMRGQPNFRGIDILLTSQWPENVFNLDPEHKVIY